MKSERELQQRREAQARYRLRHPERCKEIRLRSERKNKHRVNKAHRSQYRDRPGEHYFRKLKGKYGITSDQFDSMIISQLGRCAVCSAALTFPCVDHDHNSGRVRDILCRYCNLVLGNAKDSIKILEGAIQYLKKHGVEMAEKKKHAGHGFKHTHIEHHDDNSHTIHHVHEDGPEHDVKHAVLDLDSVHDSIQDHLGTPNPGEAQADMGQHGVPPSIAGPAGLPIGPAGA